MTEPHLVADPWLSKQLGKSAFHLTGRLDRIWECLRQLSEGLSQYVPFADAKIPVGDVVAMAAVQSLGFMLIDTNLQFEMPRACIPAVAHFEVAFASESDADRVGAIAERSFVYDRFHRDPAIPNASANALKREWARSFFANGRGDWMVTARVNGTVAGFLQLLKTDAGKLVIDLIAVDREYRGLGLGRAMIGFAATHCDGSEPLMVGTQVTNVPSVRLYESLGFRLAAAQYVLHRHGSASC